MLYGTANARIRQGTVTDAGKRPADFLLGDVWVRPDINQIGMERVEPKAMDVLLAMAAIAPKVLSTADLLELVWPGTVVVDNVVHRAVTHLRKVLGDDARAPRFIASIPRRGYRVVADVRLQAVESLADDAAHVAVNDDRGPATAAAAVDHGGNTTTAERRLQEIEVVVGRLRMLMGAGISDADINRLSMELARRALALCSSDET